MRQVAKPCQGLFGKVDGRDFGAAIGQMGADAEGAERRPFVADGPDGATE